MIWIAPFPLIYIYFLYTQRGGVDEFFTLIFLPILFVIGGEYIFFQPKLDILINDANKLFANLKYEGDEARSSFNSITDKLLLNKDRPEYIRGNLVDVHLDRVCKNESGEYFWIQASAKGAIEPTIKNLTPHAAKNLLRQDREVYIQEFNEEPYRT